MEARATDLGTLPPGPEIVVERINLSRSWQGSRVLNGRRAWVSTRWKDQNSGPTLSSGAFRGRERRVADGVSVCGKWAVPGTQGLPEAEGMGHLRLGTVGPGKRSAKRHRPGLWAPPRELNPRG